MTSTTPDRPEQLRGCPVCGGERFEERHWASFVQGAQLKRKKPWGRPLRGAVRWFVCLQCGFVAPFAETSTE